MVIKNIKNIKNIAYLICFLYGHLNAKITFTDISSTLDIRPTGSYVFSTPNIRHINGTILAPSPKNLQGSNVFYENGIYTNGDFEINLSGTYDTTNSYSFLLIGPNAHFNCFNYGVINERLFISGVGCRIEGSPSFRTPNAITLNNGSTSAIFSLQKDLDTNIILNGGDIQLDSDLRIAHDIKITGSGSIHFNFHNLELGPNDLVWTDTIIMFDAQNLVLGAKSNVRGQWKFQNNARMIGNNHTLDLTNGGSLFIAPNTTLQLFNMTLKGLGTGFIIFENSTSRLELINAIIDIDRNISMTQGNVYVSGNSTIITHDTFLTFDKTASLSVNSCTLFYDTLSYNDQNNIQFTNETNNFASINGGSVKKVRALRVGDFTIWTNTILDRSLIISPLKKLCIQNDTTIDGDGFAYEFALNPTQDIFILSAGKKAYFQNILMKDFPLNHIDIGNGASIIFGNNSTLDIGASGHVTTTWYFDGNTVLNGNNNIIDFSSDGHIVLQPGAQLWVNNITFRNIKGNDSWGSIVCMDNNCTISLGNVTWIQDADYSLTQGNFYVVGYWDLQGTSTFNYASNKQSLITSFGTLEIDKDFTFHYMPSSNNRDLIAMENSNAILNLNGGTLSSTTTGIRLTKGTLMVPDLGILYSHGAVAQSEAIAFGNNNFADDLTIRIEGNLQLAAGRLVYDNVEQ